MANVYVRSGAGGAGTGADWANAYTTLAAAFTAKAAGDDFWVSEDHAETQASAMTLTCPGTAAAPCRVVCVNHAGSVPPVAADMVSVPTGSITTTGNNTITQTGFAYWWGLIISCGSGAANPAMSLGNTGGNFNVFDTCSLRVAGTTGGTINPCATAAGAILRNTTVQFGAAGSSILPRGNILWENTPTAILGATLPTNLFGNIASAMGDVLVRNVDLSALSSKTLVSGAATGSAVIRFSRCKLPATVTKITAAGGLGTQRVELVNCANGTGRHISEAYDYAGTQTTEATIVLTGGASDGTTPHAMKIVTTANAKQAMPFVSLPILIWNDSTASVTLALQGIWGGGAVPNNDDIWMEVTYPSDASSPAQTVATCGKSSVLAANAALGAGTGTWGGSTTKFKLEVTFTPAAKGPLHIVIKVGAASGTFYIDPEPQISGVTVARTFPQMFSVANDVGSVGAGASPGQFVGG